jgi:Glycosyl hydrolases family 18/Dockerin type I domain
MRGEAAKSGVLCNRTRTRCIAISAAMAIVCVRPLGLHAQQSSVSAWDAADFRVWSFVPYWTSQSQLNSFPADGMYDHVSDVLYFSGVRPTSSGNLNYHSAATQHLATLKNHAAAHGFRLHMSMRDPSGGTEEAVWNSITANATSRANFVTQVTNLLTANNMKGFNLDWERPNTVDEWANYTQLAKDLSAAIHPLGMEVSVDDYGFADPLWDDSTVFDARAYDQLFVMGYHYPAFGGGSLNQNSFANGKLALTRQGADKAFKNEQLVLGIGTWGANGPATVSLKNIVGVNPALAYDALTFTGTVNDINGASRTGTWDIESRKQVREKTQLALDRNMAGVMSWTLHYDAVNNLGLHRVAHHYIAVERGVPDLNLDGRVNAADAEMLSNNMGSLHAKTGTDTAAKFEQFYISGNWEQGDHDGNGYVNQQDADWLADRFGALGVNLPDRLAYTGMFEDFQDAKGLAGRCQAARNGLGQLSETGNYTQQAGSSLPFAGTGVGADKHSNSAVNIRNQNAAEALDAVNSEPRTMHAELSTPIDLGEDESTYVTFLVRQNSAPLLTAQLASPNRTLSLEFLDAAGQAQFDFSFLGQQEEFSIRSQADAAGEDVSANGLVADTTYMFVGKIDGNGGEPNLLQASLFPNGSNVGNFTDPSFPWMLTAQGSARFNPLVTQLQFKSLFEANYTVSNVWIGPADEFFPPSPRDLGDFNADGSVDASDYVIWREGHGIDFSPSEYTAWRAHFGRSLATAAASQFAAPEPNSTFLFGWGVILAGVARRRRFGPK